MYEKTREEKLEAAFTQFIVDVVDMRNKEKFWKENYGAENGKKMITAQKRVDKDLVEMGINPEFDLRNFRLSFLKEILTK